MLRVRTQLDVALAFDIALGGAMKTQVDISVLCVNGSAAVPYLLPYSVPDCCPFSTMYRGSLSFARIPTGNVFG